jgi:hypothetical protein
MFILISVVIATILAELAWPVLARGVRHGTVLAFRWGILPDLPLAAMTARDRDAWAIASLAMAPTRKALKALERCDAETPPSHRKPPCLTIIAPGRKAMAR